MQSFSKTMSKKNCDLVEIFRTEHGIVHQCNMKNIFRLEFGGNFSFFKVSDFTDFIKKVNNIDIDEMAKNTSRTADVAILMPHYTDRCFVLSITDVLNLRELLNGAKFTLHLNSIIRECMLVLV